MNTNLHHNIKTAMILAAGYGTRMKELSHDTPKPLLPLNDYRIIDIILLKLAAQKIKRVIINLHYLGKKIKEYVGDGKKYGFAIAYSHEEILLNTGGGIANAESYFTGETILTTNADVLSDISLSTLFNFHQKKEAIATMAVKSSRNNKDYSLVLYDQDNNLCGFLDKNETIPDEYSTGIFTGYQILSPEARSYMRTQIQSVISNLYRPALKNNEKIKIFPFDGQWVDLGSKEQYLTFKRKVDNGEIDLKRYVK